MNYLATLEFPSHRSCCHPLCDSGLIPCLNDCALTTELHMLGMLPHLRITKQRLSHHLNGPGHLAGVLPKGLILSNPQAKYSNLPLCTRARTMCLTVSSQLLSPQRDESWLVGWYRRPSWSQVKCDRGAAKFTCPALNSCISQKQRQTLQCQFGVLYKHCLHWLVLYFLAISSCL